jgi:hypothetical protein
VPRDRPHRHLQQQKVGHTNEKLNPAAQKKVRGGRSKHVFAVLQLKCKMPSSSKLCAYNTVGSLSQQDKPRPRMNIECDIQSEKQTAAIFQALYTCAKLCRVNVAEETITVLLEVACRRGNQRDKS